MHVSQQKGVGTKTHKENIKEPTDKTLLLCVGVEDSLSVDYKSYINPP